MRTHRPHPPAVPHAARAEALCRTSARSPRPCSNAPANRCWRGVPMNWMVKWAGAFPPFVREAQGAHFYDVDGHRYIDFCLGDTGAMTGHSPFATVKAVEEQMKRGITLMLPTEDAIFVAEELQQALRAALLAVRADRHRRQPFFHPSGAPDHRRPKILVFNWCYHGTVDETLHHSCNRWRGRAAAREHWAARRSRGHHQSGRVQRRGGARSRRWPPGDVACVLAEPAMTNVGIVHPQPGYHQALRQLTRKIRHAAHHRRDPHHLRRAGRLHARRESRSRLSCFRQSHRRRSSRRGLRVHPGGGRTASRPSRNSKTATSAGSAARWRAMRFRWPPCGPR